MERMKGQTLKDLIGGKAIPTARISELGAQIADALGIPPNTAASRYRYGLTELRKLTKEVLA